MAIKALPESIGIPDYLEVIEDNPHGTGWHFVGGADQGEEAPDIDRFYVRFESAEGYRADYFHFGGRWSLGAN